MGSNYWTAVIAGVAITLVVQAAMLSWWACFHFRSQAKAAKAKAKAEIARIDPPTATRVEALARRVDSLEARLDSRGNQDIRRHAG